MTTLEVQNLSMSYRSTAAVSELSFSVAAGEIVGILGASGCGKTTTLRCIAGLLRPTSGRILLDGVPMVDETVFVQPEARGIGMVFQSYALWPHLTVANNVAYGLKRNGVPSEERRRRVEEALSLVSLDGYGTRYPGELSGGQQQRVAVARSIVTRPKALLLDEPLSNLDAKLRERMREDLRELLRPLDICTVFITHDQAEAMVIADRIIVMRDGRSVREGTARELYTAPGSQFVASILGAASFLRGVVKSVEPHCVVVATDQGHHLAASCNGDARPSPGNEVLIAIRPEAVTLHPYAEASGNCLPGTVQRASFLGGHSEFIIETVAGEVRAHSNAWFEPGAQVALAIASDGCSLVTPD